MIGVNRRRYMGGGAADEIIMTSTSNPEVLAICYAQGWAAHADYMTKKEAEDVTNIGNAFTGSSIVHFDEFQYFINASLATRAFANTASLNSIYVPVDLVYEIFYNSAVKDVYICEGVTTIGTGAFRESKQLRLIDMPSTLLSTSGNLHNCFPTTDTTIVCRATTPPSINAWGNGFRTVTIYVPDSSVAAYQAVPVWSTYAANIKPLSEYE